MLFSEIYSAYYNAVAAVLAEVINGETDERQLEKTVMRCAFSESVLTVMPSLKNEKWQLLTRDMTTPIKNIPSTPLTTLEKRWLKAISLDPRIRLFDVSLEGLEDVEPLFTSDDYFIYDKYLDGDPYYDEGYIKNFRTVLNAVREKHQIKIEMVNRRGNLISMKVFPLRLEYSEKDDKFRLITSSGKYGGTVNIARIVACQRCSGKYIQNNKNVPEKQSMVTLKICDERNALERCLLHFAHFEKQAERIDEKNYLLHIKYDKGDETEILIRVLGFGPLIEVTEPDSFRNLIISRLKKQKSCGIL